MLVVMKMTPRFWVQILEPSSRFHGMACPLTGQQNLPYACACGRL